MPAKRLVSFGCSYTYGEGLEDCISDVPGERPKFPSKYAWPNIVANNKKLNCCNLSSPGHSNKFIAEKIRRTNLSRNDVVVVLWTHFTRSCVFDIAPRPERGFPAGQGMSEEQMGDLYYRRLISSNISYVTNKDEKRWSEKFYRYFYFSYDTFLEDLESINHVYLYLKRLGIPSYHLLTDSVPFKLIEDDDKFVNLPNWNVVNFKSINWNKVYAHGRALDGDHPSALGQKELARQILRHIKY